MSTSKGQRTRVDGTVGNDGSVRCTCGKKVGHATPDGVEFHCRACNADVFVSLQQLKVNSLLRMAELIAAI